MCKRHSNDDCPCVQRGAVQHSVQVAFYVQTPDNETATLQIANQIQATTANGVLTVSLA